MKGDFLKNQFSALKKSGYGRPDEAWKNDFRSTLLMQAKNTVVPKESRAFGLGENISDIFFYIFPAKQLRFAANTAMVLLMALGIVFGGSITTVSAALNSVPGDLLYPIKIMTEGAQVRFAGDEAAKVELHVEFATRRVQEIAKINETENVDNADKIAVATEGFKQEMNTVNQYMDNIQADVAVEIAKIVDAKSEEHEEILNKVALTTVGDEAKSLVQEAKTAAENAGVKAVEVMIVTHNAASSTVSTAEVQNTLESKINNIEKKVEELSGIISASSATGTPVKATEAKTAIDEAKALNSSGAFALALDKLKESTELVRAVVALTVPSGTAANSSTPGTIISNNSSTPQTTVKVQIQTAGGSTSTPLEIQTIVEVIKDESTTTPRIIQP